MDQEVIYIGDDERNATVRAHGANRTSHPRRTVVVPAGSRRPMVIQSGGASPTVGSYSQPPVIVTQQPASFASRFNMTTGELIDSGIQLIAAIVPLPAAPVSQGEAVTDVENLVTYQAALATHAKRDEQLRTLGSLLVRILR
ncbi:MAG TPA: hypothetical protein VNO30_44335 [Kofleriaceae bacterium]|nr:hypothetical protein [Kofleriaceae bacterium]